MAFAIARPDLAAPRHFPVRVRRTFSPIRNGSEGRSRIFLQPAGFPSGWMAFFLFFALNNMENHIL
jgi:hypothetical protein